MEVFTLKLIAYDSYLLISHFQSAIFKVKLFSIRF